MMQAKNRWSWSLAVCAMLTLAACGGGSGSTGAAGTPGATALLRTQAESAGANCALGGTKLEAGLDANQNSVLDTAEVTTEAYVCNGSTGNNGTNGTSILIAVLPENIGSIDCLYGGSRVNAGADTNGDTILGTTEITSTAFVCNGAPGPGVTWLDVTSTTAQALPNRGYLANSASQVVVTLPTAPQIGDIVRISGVGTGGWKLAQNAGQSIRFGSLPTNAPAAGEVWIPREDNRNWYAVASSADGNKLSAIDQGGAIYTSVDAGVTWIASTITGNWTSLASSADGNTLVASDGVSVFVSYDAGGTWTARLSNLLNVISLDISHDGQTLLVADTFEDRVYRSTDAGISWSSQFYNLPWGVATSANGQRQAVGLHGLKRVSVSTDGGATNQEVSVSGFPFDIAISGDSSVYTVSGEGLGSIGNFGEWSISLDAGATWTTRLFDRAVTSTALSFDGRRIWIVMTRWTGALDTRLYLSTDYGMTWQARETARNWQSVASSALGDKLVAVDKGGKIYTSAKRDTTTVGTTGYFSGTQNDALELQYIGGGVFIPVSYVSYSGLFGFN